MKEKIISIIKRPDYRPMSFKDFSYLFGFSKSREKTKLKETLDSMVNSGELILNISNKYEFNKINDEDIKKGVFRAGKANYGFVELDDELFESDIFIPGHETKSAYENDIVLVKIVKHASKGKNPEGSIIKILKRATQTYVGVFHRSKNFGFVTVKSKNIESDIYIPKKYFNNVKNLDMVYVEVVKFPKLPNEKREGKIIRILGKTTDPGMDMLALVYKYGFSDTFDQNTIQEAENIKIDYSQEIKKRKDLRTERIFTIDGKSAKDLDDAVGIIKKDFGFKLFVSIADVSFYVKENGLIDQEAYKRGTSVYFPDRAIPMLPKTLSEDLCSLNPDEDKLTFTAEIDLDHDGKILKTDFYKSIIRSKARFTYEKVNDLLDGSEDDLDEDYLLLKPDLQIMKELAKVLYDRRMREGSLDLDIAEAYLEVDGDGNVTDIKQRNRGVAERMIEEFMLIANKSVAEFIYHTNITSIYRVHDDPDKEKMDDFTHFVSLMGYSLRLSKNYISAKLNEFLNGIQGEDSEYLLKKILLRALKKAEYRTDKTSHFALAFNYYTHFTSPIRRYPDLMIHRILSRIINGDLTSDYIDWLNTNLSDIALKSSTNERKAEEAEREAEKIKIAQYMYHKKGEVFEGVVSSIMNFGMFVQLSNMAEGLIRYSDMQDDYYEADMARLSAVGQKSGNVVKVGDKIAVQVINVDTDNGEIDLVFAEKTNKGDKFENQ